MAQKTCHWLFQTQWRRLLWCLGVRYPLWLLGRKCSLNFLGRALPLSRNFFSRLQLHPSSLILPFWWHFYKDKQFHYATYSQFHYATHSHFKLTHEQCTLLPVAAARRCCLGPIISALVPTNAACAHSSFYASSRKQ